MSEKCEHGVTHHGRLNAPWNGQIVNCRCCHNEFGVTKLLQVDPLNLCPACGGMVSGVTIVKDNNVEVVE